MKIVNGVDLIEISRLRLAVERHGSRFLRRVFTPGELADCGRSTASLAVRWAAKEAVAKALGTGIGDISWQEIEVLRSANGQPYLQLYGTAQVLSDRMGITAWSLSLSHSRDTAMAFAVGIGQ